MAWVNRIRYHNAVDALQKVRKDWEPEDLMQVSAPVGLVLADMVHYLGLDPSETEAALGPELKSRLAKRGVL